MLHATCTHKIGGISRFLVVRSHIANLTPDLSFGHNLRFKKSNGSCKLIFRIYVQRYFQLYKKFSKLMSFGPYIRPLKIQKFVGTPIPKMGVHLGVWGFIPSHFFALLGAWNVILGLSLGSPFANPCIGRELKASLGLWQPTLPNNFKLT
jgi:hypothetical protein